MSLVRFYNELSYRIGLEVTWDRFISERTPGHRAL